MRIFKLAVLSFVFLFLMLTIISFFLPSNIRIIKTESINSRKEMIMEQISDPSKWKNWYPGLDSAAVFYADGIPKGIIQNQEKDQLILITDRKADEVTIEYKASGKSRITGGWKLSSTENSAMIQWYMTLHVRWYPWEKFAGMLYERSLSTQMKTGLVRLRELIEAK